MSTPPPPQDISLWGIFSEARSIIKAYKKHFTILSLLLVLPYSFLLLIYPTLFPTASQSSTPTFLLLLYWIILGVFALSATGTITYSAYHGYYNRPLDLTSTLKSLSSSFIPLFSTQMVMQLIFSLIGFVVGALGFLLYNWLESNGTHSSYKDEYFTLTIIILGLVTIVFVTYITLSYIVANVVVVVESKWGYAPLKRSAYLMKGMKMMGFKMIVLGLLNSLLMWSCFWSSWEGDMDKFWMWILKMVVGSFWMSVVTKYLLAANVVLYIHCMKMHGELDMEIQPEEYVSLLIDDHGNKSVHS